jgi:hypothetical protein
MVFSPQSNKIAPTSGMLEQAGCEIMKLNKRKLGVNLDVFV